MNDSNPQNLVNHSQEMIATTYRKLEDRAVIILNTTAEQLVQEYDLDDDKAVRAAFAFYIEGLARHLTSLIVNMQMQLDVPEDEMRQTLIEMFTNAINHSQDFNQPTEGE